MNVRSRNHHRNIQYMVSLKLKWEVTRAGCIQVFYNCAQCVHDNGTTFK